MLADRPARAAGLCTAKSEQGAVALKRSSMLATNCSCAVTDDAPGFYLSAAMQICSRTAQRTILMAAGELRLAWRGVRLLSR